MKIPRLLFDLKDVLPKSNVCVRAESVLSDSSVKWSVLANLKSQPRGKNFQSQKPVQRSSPHHTRTNKNTKNTFKIN